MLEDFYFVAIGGTVLATLVPFIFNKDKVSNSNTDKSRNNQLEIIGDENYGMTENKSPNTNNNSTQYLNTI